MHEKQCVSISRVSAFTVLEFPRCFDRYAHIHVYIYMYVCIYVHSWWQRQMMHIKRSETRTRSPAGNNALMSRRRSDYGGFTLVIVISQRARVATLSFLSFHLEKLCARLNGNIFFLRFLLRLFRYNLLFRCLQLLQKLQLHVVEYSIDTSNYISRFLVRVEMDSHVRICQVSIRAWVCN